MTAPSASPDLQALATTAGCPPAKDRHRLDCLVRWLLEHGWDGEPLDIEAGIGRLRIGLPPDAWCCLPVTSLVLIIVGFFAIMKIVDIEV